MSQQMESLYHASLSNSTSQIQILFKNIVNGSYEGTVQCTASAKGCVAEGLAAGECSGNGSSDEAPGGGGAVSTRTDVGLFTCQVRAGGQHQDYLSSASGSPALQRGLTRDRQVSKLNGVVPDWG